MTRHRLQPAPIDPDLQAQLRITVHYQPHTPETVSLTLGPGAQTVSPNRVPQENPS